jgi:hypothetical protein
VVESGVLRRRYDLILAPHHGSHPVPPGFPSSRVCVSQAGPTHWRAWEDHLGSHEDSGCMTTHGRSDPIVVL